MSANRCGYANCYLCLPAEYRACANAADKKIRATAEAKKK